MKLNIIDKLFGKGNKLERHNRNWTESEIRMLGVDFPEAYLNDELDELAKEFGRTPLALKRKYRQEFKSLREL